MRVSNRSRAVLVAAGITMLMPATMTGQKAQDAMQAAELARSYQIQADLNSIEKNRALAAQELLSQWQNVLDPSTYDLFDELGSIVDKVPAWQLYGASKTSDFSTMLGILRGRIPGGTLH
jgi:hypothetical protein